ncbi:MAG TPA: ornithine cyclodeaminase family protein [Cerasibacillus sp.]|uniref:ornithine cyclodeaminase family protein n=1 Tax=Cerasibacillus sp. TaxID=2498711 RepID=UPI002F3FC7A4
MIILSEHEIMKHYSMTEAIRDLEAGLTSMNEGKIDNPHRTVIEYPEQYASILYMPSSDQQERMAGIKTVSIFPENTKVGKSTTQGVLLLTDTRNGEHVCLMNASYLTRLRTGALSGIATKKLSRKDSSVLGVIGTGGMAFEQVLGVLEVRDIEKIIMFNRTREKADRFKEKLLRFGVTQNITVVDNVDEVVLAADIINCATRSLTPVFDGKLLKKGTHINGVGSYLPSMREVDEETILKSDKIVVDDIKGVKEEAGEFIHAANNGHWSFAAIYSELRELLGKACHREGDDEITFFKSVGAAYFDMALAQGVYREAKEKQFGITVTV